MPEVEISAILAELREKTRDNSPARAFRQPFDRRPPAVSPVDLATIARYDILAEPFTSHRGGILGKLIIRIKNFARELLVQILERQVRYNEANAEIARGLSRTTEYLARAQSGLREQLGSSETDLSTRLKAIESDFAGRLEAVQLELQRHKSSVQDTISTTLNEHLAGLRSQIRETSESFGKSIAELRSDIGAIPPHVPIENKFQELQRLVLDQQRRIAILLEEFRRSPRNGAPNGTSRPIEERDHLLDTYYVMLEDQFRGTRNDIKQRLEVYLPYIRELKFDDAKMLDIGCGRGEFLELLHSQNVPAEGVDFNSIFVDECRAMGFEVAQADVLTFLRERKSNSYAAVSAIHVVEHLPLRTLVALLDEAFRVLRPGGVLILETPNPENLLVASSNFYIDPTHRKPLPNLLLSFLAENRGFCRVQVLKLHPSPEDVRLEPSVNSERLNHILYGPQDYAVLGYKV
jgi:2-polyprenyl-3-methyl-5-hydroxy-6-metoxy-1,4-benzoquinol methylase